MLPFTHNSISRNQSLQTKIPLRSIKTLGSGITLIGQAHHWLVIHGSLFKYKKCRWQKRRAKSVYIHTYPHMQQTNKSDHLLCGWAKHNCKIVYLSISKLFIIWSCIHMYVYVTQHAKREMDFFGTMSVPQRPCPKWRFPENVVNNVSPNDIWSKRRLPERSYFC
jgi:hypothetical protein